MLLVVKTIHYVFYVIKTWIRRKDISREQIFLYYGVITPNKDIINEWVVIAAADSYLEGTLVWKMSASQWTFRNSCCYDWDQRYLE